MITLRQPTDEECQLVRVWRNAPDVMPMLRTGYKSEADQAAFYRDVICDPRSGHRYYAIEHDGQFVGLGGLTYLDEQESSPLAHQITLVMGPAFRRQGYGLEAVKALLAEAFGPLRLDYVQGECYPEGPVAFWRRCFESVVVCGGDRLDVDGRYTWRWRKP